MKSMSFLTPAFHCVLFLIALPPAAAVTIDWAPVGSPGNPSDAADGDRFEVGVQHFGTVNYNFSIAKYDVTNGQYAEFLNASDPTGGNALRLYSSEMGTTSFGGILYNSASSNGSKYSTIAGRENQPVTFVSWFSAIRFTNWFGNGQGGSDTESGAYTLLGGTPTPSNALSVARNPTALVFLPNENEWYKAAFYDPTSNSYFQYPTSSNSLPVASGPTSAPNAANYQDVLTHPTDVGAYANTTSPVGAFDMAGNVVQWTDTRASGVQVRVRGSAWGSPPEQLLSDSVYYGGVTGTGGALGFRIAAIPEPSTYALATISVIGLLAFRRRTR